MASRDLPRYRLIARHVSILEIAGTDSAYLATLLPVVRPPILALGGVQLLLPVLQWSGRTERT